jgi:hypothetical protein
MTHKYDFILYTYYDGTTRSAVVPRGKKLEPPKPKLVVNGKNLFQAPRKSS